jgi:hypothetical protein
MKDTIKKRIKEQPICPPELNDRELLIWLEGYDCCLESINEIIEEVQDVNVSRSDSDRPDR